MEPGSSENFNKEPSAVKCSYAQVGYFWYQRNSVLFFKVLKSSFKQKRIKLPSFPLTSGKHHKSHQKVVLLIGKTNPGGGWGGEVKPERWIFLSLRPATSAGPATADEVILVPTPGDQRQIVTDAKIPDQEGEPVSYQRLPTSEPRTTSSGPGSAPLCSVPAASAQTQAPHSTLPVSGTDACSSASPDTISPLSRRSRQEPTAHPTPLSSRQLPVRRKPILRSASMGIHAHREQKQ